ncbi:MAG: PQQ-dependent sugar dehydrogenase [Limnobacter sp.]|nr:PQQ-dependent sugar dehydrogenase [Limnobacter sp.]
MFNSLRWHSYIVPFLQAAVFGVVAGTITQTQINLHFIQSIGGQVSLADRLGTTVHDLLNFTPTFVVLFVPGFLISQCLAFWVSKRLRQIPRVFWMAVAGAASLWLAITVLDVVAPTPGIVYATVPTFGLLLLMACAGLAGVVFEWRTSVKEVRMGAGRFRSFAVLAVLAALLPTAGWSAGGYQTTVLADNLNKPWSLGFLPDGRALITEKPGSLRLLSANGKLDPKPIEGVPEVLFQGQGGLLEVLPSFDFASSQMVYLSYSCGRSSANHTCVAKGKLDGYTLTDVQEIFRSQFAKRGGAHFGGRMVWLADNTLVLTLGDGYTYRNEAQNNENHLGTLVRLNPDGSVPKDNPFVNDSKAKPEIYSYGHRNVQGLVYDAANNRLYEQEHGAKGGDEINLVEPGKNYGWPLATYGVDYSGAEITPFTQYEGTEQPIVYWTPSIAPSGMALYTGDLFSQWKGHLLVGALAGRHLRLVKLDGTKVVGQEVLLDELNARIRDVRQGPDGAVYVLTDSTQGQLIKLTPAN